MATVKEIVLSRNWVYKYENITVPKNIKYLVGIKIPGSKMKSYKMFIKKANAEKFLDKNKRYNNLIKVVGFIKK